MEKKKYVKPILASEEFIPQEYIAACGDTDFEYLFECNANSHGWFTNGGEVYVDSNNNGKWEFGKDRFLGSYSPCSKTHKTKDNDEFLDGFLVTIGGDDNHLINKQKVKIWRGEDGRNIHCTTKLDMNSWETAKS